jgi:hypothetical protein
MPAVDQKTASLIKKKLDGINLQFSGMALYSAILLGFIDSTKMADK